MATPKEERAAALLAWATALPTAGQTALCELGGFKVVNATHAATSAGQVLHEAIQERRGFVAAEAGRAGVEPVEE